MEFLRNGADDDEHFADVHAESLVRSHEAVTPDRVSGWVKLNLFSAAEAASIYTRYEELIGDISQEDLQ